MVSNCISEMDVGGSSSSSSSSYRFQSVGGSSNRQPVHFHSTLHSVRKPVMTKPLKKQPVAPLPRMRPRVFKVDPMNFRDVVQKLTGANEIYDHRLKTMAPTPLTVSSPLFYSKVSDPPLPVQPKTTLSSMLMQELKSEGVEVKAQKMNEGMEESGFLALNLSPSSPNWFHLPIVSPGTISTLDII